METKTMFKIARDFSSEPFGRYPSDGPFNGEKFREDILRPLLSRYSIVTVDIDGTEGYGSSFLEEAFGGLVRKGYFTAEDLRHHLKISSHAAAFRTYVTSIWKYIDQASNDRATA